MNTMNTIQDGVMHTFGTKGFIAKIIKRMLLVIMVLVIVIIIISQSNHEIVIQIGSMVGINLGTWIPVVGIITVALFTLVQIIIAWIEYVSTQFQVTENALIVKKGFFVKQENSFPLRYINNVSHNRGILDQLLGVGTCVVDMVSDEKDAVHADKVSFDDMDQGMIEELENILLTRAQAQKIVVATV